MNTSHKKIWHDLPCEDPECEPWDHVKEHPHCSEAHIIKHIMLRSDGPIGWFRSVMDALTWTGHMTIHRSEYNELNNARRKCFDLQTEVARVKHIEEENKNLRAQIIQLKKECKKNS